MSWVIPYVGCINLKERTDRYLRSCNHFARLRRYLTFDSVEWYHPVRDPQGGEAGCTRSHLFHIRTALKLGVPYALIFEDDFEPTEMLPYIHEIQEFVEENSTWDILNLGGLPNIFRRTTKLVVENSHCAIYKGQCILAHAYLISRRYMERIANMDYIGIAIDRMYESTTEGYFVYAPLFRQDLSPTSIGEHEFASSKLKHMMITTQQWYATTVNFPIEIAAYALLGGILLSVLLWIFMPNFWHLWGMAIVVLVIVFAALLLPYYECS